jgi:tetratricopeptide (TPR) repeat protein
MQLLAVEAEYFLSRGYNSQALDLLHHAAQTARHDGQVAVAHHLFTKLGNAFLQYVEQFERAFEAYMEALALARVMKDAHREATLLALLGTTRFRLGESDADTYYERAYHLAEAHNDEKALCAVLNHRSYYEGQKTPPDFERSWQFSNEAIEIARARAMPEPHFASLMNRGNCERILGYHDTALGTHQQAFELACQHDNHHWKASALRALGEDYHELGEQTRAQHYFDESLALWWQTGSAARANSLISYMREHNYHVKSEASAL